VTDRAELVELIEELVEAHLDTVSMDGHLDRDWPGHVHYLQALVRESQARLAWLGLPSAA
jgi:hypothetical protein